MKDDPLFVVWFEVPDEWSIGNLLVNADVTTCGIGTVAQRERVCVCVCVSGAGWGGESMRQARHNQKKEMIYISPDISCFCNLKCFPFYANRFHFVLTRVRLTFKSPVHGRLDCLLNK